MGRPSTLPRTAHAQQKGLETRRKTKSGRRIAQIAQRRRSIHSRGLQNILHAWMPQRLSEVPLMLCRQSSCVGGIAVRPRKGSPQAWQKLQRCKIVARSDDAFVRFEAAGKGFVASEFLNFRQCQLLFF